MGVFSKYHRFREAGEEANVNNVERFGPPHHSLFTSSRVFTLHHDIEITDDAGSVRYRAYTQFPSIRDKTDITDAEGRPVAHVERKFFSIHQRHFITMADGRDFEMSSELFHLVKDVTDLEGLGWQLRGNVLALNFELYDRDGDVVAVISQKFMSLHDKYCVDVYRPEHEKIIVAVLVTLQHMIRDRESTASAGAASASSSS